MSDFVCFFPSQQRDRPPAPFSELGSIFEAALRDDRVPTEVARDGAAVLRTRCSEAAKPRFHASEDGTGWVVVKGHVFDVGSEEPAVDLGELLGRLLKGGPAQLNRYEGTFALAAWDARGRQGWAVNDQVSAMNLYYGESDGGLYVSTNAAALARALGLGLDPHGVQELLARGALLAPTAMFAGLRRVDIGEHVRYRAGALSRGRHWHAYEPVTRHRSMREAADSASSVVLDRVARYAATSSGPMIADLTGGLDTRLVTSAAHAANLRFTVTVNGAPEHLDVRLAHRLAGLMGWEMEHFDPRLLWTKRIDPEMRRELLYRTGGELPFTEAYHHLLTRPQLARDFGLHFLGGGGEMFHYYPWSHEFLGIGRRRPANVDRLLDYRFFSAAPPPSFFSGNWLPDLRSRLRSHVEAICNERQGALTTQQLDAVYTWKKTGHDNLYASAVYSWLPSVLPLLTAGVMKAAIAMPWRMRLTTQLQRAMIFSLSPRAAEVTTTYGGTAEPTSLKNLHLAAWRSAKRGAFLLNKMDRTLLNGKLTKLLTPRIPVAGGATLLLMPQVEDLLVPETMLSRRLYAPTALREVLRGSAADRQAHYQLLMRLATVEAWCRELSFEPEEDFLAS